MSLDILDENLQVIKKMSSDEYDNSYIIFNTDKYPNAKYLKITGLINNKEKIKMEYYYGETANEKLKNKIIVGYGDSLTAGPSNATYTWLGKVVSYTKMIPYNRGIGGTAVYDTGVTAWLDMNNEYLGSTIDKTNNLEPSEKHISINAEMEHDDRIATIPETADIIVLFAGTNGMDEASYRNTLNKISKRIPNAKIICVNIPYRQDENDEGKEYYSEWRNIITNLANEYNYPLIQMQELMGVNSQNATLYMADYVHWNERGKTIMANIIINKINECIKNGYIK